MRRTGAGLVVALIMLLVVPAVPVAAAPPTTGPTTSTTVAPPKAYVLVDADTGAVLVANADRVPRPPASLTKVLTALAASATVPHDGKLTISERAAAQPANKVGATAGQVWPTVDAMHVMLLQSANDIALAFAEAVGGSAEAFQDVLARTATAVGMQDPQTWRDPAGLDDQGSLGGGNSVSARDMAIAGRALIADPWLSPIAAKPRYSFTAPDGVLHDAVNHNKMVLGRYPGAIGGKTGYTKKAGNSLFASAQRNGRTMVAVVMDTKDEYGFTAQLFDQGFATPVAAETKLEHLPPLRLPNAAQILPPTPSPPPTEASVSPDPEPPRVQPEGAFSYSLPASPTPVFRPLQAPVEHRSAVPLLFAGGSLVLVAGIGGYRRRTQRRRRSRSYQVPGANPTR